VFYVVREFGGSSDARTKQIWSVGRRGVRGVKADIVDEWNLIVTARSRHRDSTCGPVHQYSGPTILTSFVVKGVLGNLVHKGGGCAPIFMRQHLVDSRLDVIFGLYLIEAVRLW
jgi:hypothetical protein